MQFIPSRCMKNVTHFLDITKIYFVRIYRHLELTVENESFKTAERP